MNSIQEKQLSFNKPKYKGCFDEKYFIFCFVRFASFIIFAFIGLATLLTAPELGLSSILKLVCVDFIAGLSYLGPNLIQYGKYFINKITNKKFDLFMKYKEDLNSRVKLVEERIDSKTMNPVIEKKIINP